MSKYETLVQATMLGRVERLTGISIQSNPYSKGSDPWIAFSEGWNRSLDDPKRMKLHLIQAISQIDQIRGLKMFIFMPPY